MNKVLIALFLSLTSFSSYSQEIDRMNETEMKTQKSIHLLSKTSKTANLLRWAPLSPENWKRGNDFGYHLERICISDIDRTTKMAPTYTSLGIIKPWPLKDWKVFVEQENYMPLIAAQAIFGEDKIDYQSDGFIAASQAFENKFGFAILAADLYRECADASGLFYEDKDIRDSATYIYRLTLVNPYEKYKIDTSYAVMVAGTAPLSDIPVLNEARGRESKIVLKWENSPLTPFSAFHIERSVSGKDEWRRLNKLPYLELKSNLTKGSSNITYTDSLAGNDVKYDYRVIGIDAFGDLSGPSRIVSGMAKDLTPPSQPTDVYTQVDGPKSVTIKWNYTIDEKSRDCVGFRVYHSYHPSNFFERPIHSDILSLQSRSFTHHKPSGTKENYYLVAAVDLDGNESRSIARHAFIVDEIPPAQPQGLTGYIDTTGHVQVSWIKGTEEDIYGYDVYFANSSDHIFSKRSRGLIQDTIFTDSITLNTLTEDIYYYIIALDASFNESEKSETLKLNKPDIIPPVASVFEEYLVGDDAIFIKWISSTSSDAIQQNLYRQAEDEDWRLVNSFDMTKTSYLDGDVIENKKYSYRIEVIDDAGLSTYCPVNLTLTASGPFFMPKPYNVRIAKEEDSTQLLWDYQDAMDTQFMVYKNIDNRGFVKYKKVKGFSLTIGEDKGMYSYAVKALRKDGKESQLSEMIANK